MHSKQRNNNKMHDHFLLFFTLIKQKTALIKSVASTVYRQQLLVIFCPWQERCYDFFLTSTMGSAPLNESLNVFRFRRKLGPSATTAMAPSCISVVKLKTSSIVLSDASIPPACTHRKLYGIRPTTRRHKLVQLSYNHHKLRK